jgi:uncharacterized membrane protein YoaK (UPF0700 family)
MDVPKKSLERILGLSALASGAVDIISFAKLGGIFASAMTGNLAFLAFYISQFSVASAIGSGVALVGFIVGGALGTLLARGQDQCHSLRRLLVSETLLLAASAGLWFPTRHDNGSLSCNVIIALLAISMGLQAILGKRINLSNIPTIVFTSTLINIVVALTDMLASGNFTVPPDTKRQCVSFLLYFFGALGAGFAVYDKLEILIFIPFALAAAALFVMLQGGTVDTKA